MTVKPVPQGFHSVTANLVVDDAAAALDFYRKAFGATIEGRVEIGGKVIYSEIRIGDSMVMVCDEMPAHGFAAPDREAPVSVSLNIYCEDADALHSQAVAAGATQISEVSDHMHGDRGRVGARSLRPSLGHRNADRGHLGGGDATADSERGAGMKRLSPEVSRRRRRSGSGFAPGGGALRGSQRLAYGGRFARGGAFELRA